MLLFDVIAILHNFVDSQKLAVIQFMLLVCSVGYSLLNKTVAMENEVRQRTPHGIEKKHEHTSLTQVVKKIDAFNKLPNECVNSTSGGGGGKKCTTFHS